MNTINIAITVINVLLLLINVIILGLSIKIFTEYVKDKAMDKRIIKKDV